MSLPLESFLECHPRRLSHKPVQVFVGFSPEMMMTMRIQLL